MSHHPVGSRDMTPHHLVFRSQGGTDDPSNVVGLCSCCHLQLIHTEGSIKAEPPATHMTWKTPILEVQGRDVAWRRGA
ncbi:MAG: HNH endonuclease [Myxococcota bacterium]